MNTISELALKGLRKVFYHDPVHIAPFLDAEVVSENVYALLAAGKPCMVARFGSTELNLWTNVRGIRSGLHSIRDFVTGKQPQWWWNRKSVENIRECSGFFPCDEPHLYAFADLMDTDCAQLDILGSWRPEERFIPLQGVKKVPLVYLEPFWVDHPWTRALAGKKVLVVHPFSEEIQSQYRRRRLLFLNPEILPEFSLSTLKAVQSLGGEGGAFRDWFDALDHMKRKMDGMDYDIALIGCGAYGFPLAAHAKRTGHQAVHLGGALQLLFGIKGARWEDPDYGVAAWGIPRGFYPALFNEAWIRPGEHTRPANAEQVENGCYW